MSRIRTIWELPLLGGVPEGRGGLPDRPARESLREFSMGELQASPEQCIYVGDSYEADYLGAKSAGIRALLIDPLHETPVVNEDRIESVFEVEKRVAEVESG